MSNILPAGTPAPDFTLHARPDQTVTLKGLRGRPVILRFPQHSPSLYARGSEGEPGCCQSARQGCQAKGGDAWSDRARLAACAEAVDCSDPRHDQVVASRREHRLGRNQTYIGRPARN